MKTNQLRFFFGKIVTSFADIFTMEKALCQIIFGHYIFISIPNFKIFAAVYKTLRLQNSNIVICF